MSNECLMNVLESNNEYRRKFLRMLSECVNELLNCNVYLSVLHESPRTAIINTMTFANVQMTMMFMTIWELMNVQCSNDL